jgi:hypothetical protein
VIANDQTPENACRFGNDGALFDHVLRSDAPQLQAIASGGHASQTTLCPDFLTRLKIAGAYYRTAIENPGRHLGTVLAGITLSCRTSASAWTPPGNSADVPCWCDTSVLG